MNTIIVLLTAAICCAAPVEIGFVPLFNGKDLSGWKLMGKEGQLYT